MKAIGLNTHNRILYVDSIDANHQGVVKMRDNSFEIRSFFINQPECKGHPGFGLGEYYKLSTRKPSKNRIIELGKTKIHSYTSEEFNRIFQARVITSSMIKF